MVGINQSPPLRQRARPLPGAFKQDPLARGGRFQKRLWEADML